ncbi:30S ribosomal protein S14 [Candidatus Dojkabacteria bacterium]|uniref:Small ribosomal subunit protein uS14 n=1 Tax=Candidatus Dojkabacteria bacterium TaxID=2099670 RepID=A0A955L2F6_9BACT|nr:30S ribosomal protein S14 [Candidatus Dojkabacteria bacterium]
MASKAAIAKQKRRQKLVDQYADKRARLIEEGDVEGLRKLPRNSSPTRLRNRCELTGRPRGYIRRFKMSRIALREHALKGELPGVRKISW